MQVQQFVLGMFETNCYIVTGQETGKCVLIDPADDAKTLINYMEEKKKASEAHMRATAKWEKESIRE